MFFLLPIGLEDSRVNRIPWVSICIAALTVLLFVPTWVLREEPLARSMPALSKAIEYWEAHPYARPSKDTLKQLGISEAALDELTLKQASIPRPPDDELAAQSQHLEELLAPVVKSLDDDLLRKLSVVPSRGFKQIGWLTSMFIHAGWMHLLGNLLFFYIVAAFLEDVWGRPLFAAFYLVGGVFASVAQATLDMHSSMMNLGASGAIAACMGAFTFRFPSRRIGVFYWFWVIRMKMGIIKVPAWIAGALWFTSQVFDFWVNGKDATVGFMAHLAGFAFGFVVALGLKASKVEEKYIAPKVDAPAWQVDPRVEKARAALEQGDSGSAQALYAEILREKPDDVEALSALARLACAAGNAAEGTRYAAKLLGRFAAAQDSDGLRWVVQEVGASLDLSALPVQLCYRVAEALEEGDWRIALRWYQGSARGEGLVAAKAHLRAGELLSEHREDYPQALAHGQAALKMVSGQPALVERAQKLVALADSRKDLQSAPSSFQPAATGAEVPREVELIEGRLAAARPDRAFVEQPSGERREVMFRDVVGIAAGQVGNALLVDLVTRWSPQQTFRLRVAPAHAPAFHRFLAQVVEASGASCIPSKEAVLAQPLTAYADAAAFEAECYASLSA